MVAVAETNGAGYLDWEVSPRGVSRFPTWFVPGRVHRGGANVLFCDGHVTWYRQEELLVELINFSVPADPLKARRRNYDHEP
jgi:prepilin-type processing-associated H-X9-DG protein